MFTNIQLLSHVLASVLWTSKMNSQSKWSQPRLSVFGNPTNALWWLVTACLERAFKCQDDPSWKGRLYWFGFKSRTSSVVAAQRWFPSVPQSEINGPPVVLWKHIGSYYSKTIIIPSSTCSRVIIRLIECLSLNSGLYHKPSWFGAFGSLQPYERQLPQGSSALLEHLLTNQTLIYRNHTPTPLTLQWQHENTSLGWAGVVLRSKWSSWMHPRGPFNLCILELSDEIS